MDALEFVRCVAVPCNRRRPCKRLTLALATWASALSPCAQLLAMSASGCRKELLRQIHHHACGSRASNHCSPRPTTACSSLSPHFPILEGVHCARIRCLFPPSLGKARAKTDAAAAGEAKTMERQHPAVPLLPILLLLALLSPAARGSESPQYATVRAESDFEVRHYRDTVWMSAPSDDISFHVATKLGFHRLFQYLMGANLNSSRIRMTTPILTSIVPGAGPLHSSVYFVRLYLPVEFQASPPVPLPELNLHPDRWAGHCVAVRSFSGYARDHNIVEEAEKLALSLSRSPWGNSTSHPSKNAYSIAQYNSPFHIVGRVNEVWFDVDCRSAGVEAY